MPTASRPHRLDPETRRKQLIAPPRPLLGNTHLLPHATLSSCACPTTALQMWISSPSQTAPAGRGRSSETQVDRRCPDRMARTWHAQLLACRIAREPRGCYPRTCRVSSRRPVARPTVRTPSGRSAGWPGATILEACPAGEGTQLIPCLPGPERVCRPALPRHVRAGRRPVGVRGRPSTRNSVVTQFVTQALSAWEPASFREIKAVSCTAARSWLFASDSGESWLWGRSRHVGPTWQRVGSAMSLAMPLEVTGRADRCRTDLRWERGRSRPGQTRRDRRAGRASGRSPARGQPSRARSG